jgi:hypothetical protein
MLFVGIYVGNPTDGGPRSFASLGYNLVDVKNAQAWTPQVLFDQHNGAVPLKASVKDILKVANLKVQRDYYKAMQIVLQRTQAPEEDEDEGQSMDLSWRR